MAIIKRRTTSSVRVSKTALEEATLTLEDLPEKPKEVWSLREAIAMLQDAITDALNKGYRYEEVAKILSQKNIDISASSLKSYLSSAKRKDLNGTGVGRRPRKSKGSLDSNLEEVNGSQSYEAAPVSAPKRGRRPKQAALEPSDLDNNGNGLVSKPGRRKSTTILPAKTVAKTKPAARTKSTASVDAPKSPRGRRKKES